MGVGKGGCMHTSLVLFLFDGYSESGGCSQNPPQDRFIEPRSSSNALPPSKTIEYNFETR